MIQSSRNLLALWDYGWCEHERIALPRCHSPQDFIGVYRRSNAFGTSFVGPNPPHTPEIHGPFWSSAVSESDFELISSQRFLDLVAAIRRTEGFTSQPVDEQWQPVERLAAEISSRFTWLFMLRLTDDDQEHFHDWGYVLTIFREFICANPGEEFAERLVFGYD